MNFYVIIYDLTRKKRKVYRIFCLIESNILYFISGYFMFNFLNIGCIILYGGKTRNGRRPRKLKIYKRAGSEPPYKPKKKILKPLKRRQCLYF